MMEILINDKDVSLRINVLATFASLGSIKPVSSVIELLGSSEVDHLRIAILGYVENINIKKLDPFLQYRLFNTLQKICLSHASKILRATAIKLWIQYGPLDKTVPFIMKGLEDKDDRVVANVIEGLKYLDYPGIVKMLLPFLNHKIPRVRANCIVTLSKYPEIKDKVLDSLNALINSRNEGEIISGVWAAGEINKKSYRELLIKLLRSDNEGIQRNVPIALLKMGYKEYGKNIVDIILGKDEKNAINACYLSLNIDKTILNEHIIATIYGMGEPKRQLAIKRYSLCGGFCREQLELLKGRMTKESEI